MEDRQPFSKKQNTLPFFNFFPTTPHLATESLKQITNKQTRIGDKKTNTLTHKYKYILIAPVMCTDQLPVLH